MSKHDHEEHHEEEHDAGEELWLISYSDMMTLLFGFFVIMYSLSKATPAQQEAAKKSMSRSLAGSYVPEDTELATEIKQLAKEAQDVDMLGQLEVDEPKDGLEITFRSNLLFDSGSADLRPQVRTIMKQLVGIILKSVNDAEIMVAGHTDDVPIKTVRFPSNWELSASRAATVVKEFEENGYRGELLVAMGYGSSRPSYPNRSADGTPIPANREKNRRVVIKVVSPGVVKQPSPLGKPKAGESKGSVSASSQAPSGTTGVVTTPPEKNAVAPGPSIQEAKK
jgi:chemotaxis protein MotB